MMMFDPKILDLKYHINGLMPETICESFVKFFEENVDSSTPEQSYKYKEKKMMRDNFNCINLSQLRNVDEKFVYLIMFYIFKKKYVLHSLTN